jgi:hypothetical protein
MQTRETLFYYRRVVRALTGTAVMPNEEMISAGRLRKLKKRLLARPETGKDGKNSLTQRRQDAKFN